jgi:hypothetical protein
VVAVYVLDQVETVGLEQGHHLGLLGRFVANVLDGLLDHPAAVTVLRKLEDVLLDDDEEALPVLLFAALEHFLEDVVAELVFG